MKLKLPVAPEMFVAAVVHWPNGKARLPLAAAKVTVMADEENPGYYKANFYLRPHFQLEGMDIGMSLVSRLPAAEGAA